MGAPTETWRDRTVSCSKCPETRVVETHHMWDSEKSHGFADEQDLDPPYEVRFEKEGWELRSVERSVWTKGNSVMVYVEFVCPKCVAEERKGKEVVKA